MRSKKLLTNFLLRIFCALSLFSDKRKIDELVEYISIEPFPLNQGKIHSWSTFRIEIISWNSYFSICSTCPFIKIWNNVKKLQNLISIELIAVHLDRQYKIGRYSNGKPSEYWQSFQEYVYKKQICGLNTFLPQITVILLKLNWVILEER